MSEAGSESQSNAVPSMTEPVVVGQTTYLPQKVDSDEGPVDILVVEGFAVSDADHAYQVKYDPRKKRNFYVSLAGKGSTWRLPDIVAGEDHKDALQRSRGVSTASAAPVVEPHPERVVVGSTVYVLATGADGTQKMVLEGCAVDDAAHSEHVWSVRYNRGSGKYFYANKALGEKVWELPEVSDEVRAALFPNNKENEVDNTEQKEKEGKEESAEAVQEPDAAQQPNENLTTATTAAVEEPTSAAVPSVSVTNSEAERPVVVADVAGASNDLKAALTQLKAWKARAEAAEASVSAAKSDIAKFESTNEQLNKTLTGQTSQLRAAVQKSAELEHEIAVLRSSECASCTEAAVKRKRAEEALALGVREHTAKMEAKDTEVESLRRELVSMQKQMMDLKTMHENESRAHVEAKQQLSTLKTQLADDTANRARLAALQTEVKELRQQQQNHDKKVRQGTSHCGIQTTLFELDVDVAADEEKEDGAVQPQHHMSAVEREVHLLACADGERTGPFTHCSHCGGYRADVVCHDCAWELCRPANHNNMSKCSSGKFSPRGSATNYSPILQRAQSSTLLQTPALNGTSEDVRRSLVLTPLLAQQHPVVPPLTAAGLPSSCMSCERRRRILVRQRDEITSLKSNVARMEVEILQLSEIVAAKHPLMDREKQQRLVRPLDPVELREARRVVREQRGEIESLRGLLLKHLAMSPCAGSATRRHLGVEENSPNNKYGDDGGGMNGTDDNNNNNNS
eukprot:PhM_4_TR3412/c0_g1_i1/m.82382